MKIRYFTPFSLDKNLGHEYNSYMKELEAGDYGVIMDGDTCFLTPDYGKIIADYINLYPNAILTCKTNRIHRLSKQLDGELDCECDIRKLMMRAYKVKHLRTVTEIKPGEGLSGLLMIVPRNLWEKIRFREIPGILGIDSQFRKDIHAAGKKIYIMEGLFIFHIYRLLDGVEYKGHLL